LCGVQACPLIRTFMHRAASVDLGSKLPFAATFSDVCGAC